MANEEMIRQQMAETRTALTEKLEILEDKVSDTVMDATNAVSATVETRMPKYDLQHGLPDLHGQRPRGVKLWVRDLRTFQ